MSPDQRLYIDYGYTSGNKGPENARGYKLKDRGASPTLIGKVYEPLMQLPYGSLVVNLGAGDGNLEANAPARRRYTFLSIDQDQAGVASITYTFERMNGFGRNDRAVVGDITTLGSSGLVNPGTADAAVAWRVVHALPPEIHQPFFKQINGILRPGAHFYVAALSDKDWKAKELQEKGVYIPGEVNECVDVMRFAEAGIPKRTWPLYFFSEQRLTQLAENSGFVPAGDVETFGEASGFDHLLHTPGRENVTYHFIDLYKPETNGRGATTIVDFNINQKLAS